MKLYAKLIVNTTKIKVKASPFLTCLDFGVCEAIRLVRFGYNTFTECVV
mgnify:CR=1 FL=1